VGVTQPVGLDDKAEVGPEEVDEVAVDPALSLRDRQAGATDQTQEAPLQLGVGEQKDAVAEQRPQRSHPTLARVAGKG
jgi:hypothetical protein